jgi:hypothetical protein
MDVVLRELAPTTSEQEVPGDDGPKVPATPSAQGDCDVTTAKVEILSAATSIGAIFKDFKAGFGPNLNSVMVI